MRSSRRLQLKTHRRSGRSCNHVITHARFIVHSDSTCHLGQHLHCHHPIPAELLTDDGRDAAGVAGGFIARDDRPTDSNGICMRIFILGALNISLFWSLLFISVYRLPGGVAATVGAVQPLMVVFISAALLGSPIRLMAVLGAICGTAGVALLVLTPNAALDPVGVAAGLAGAVSMAFGTVLTRKWQPPVPLLTFTAWQLAAGGLLLVPVALVFDPPIPMPTGTNVLGLAWLGLIGAGLTYFLWFRGISRLEPTVVSLLGFLSPGTAVLLGWLFLDQTLSALQIIGVLLVIGDRLGQRSNRTPRARIACRKSP
uniref:EamA domain-containing protein n=1 Tax=Escherichia coli TaxID=562 RepID=A0A8F1IF56_ECOLX|nr:hypothetical protein EOLPNHPH_00032 [Escherichia coli]